MANARETRRCYSSSTFECVFGKSDFPELALSENDMPSPVLSCVRIPKWPSQLGSSMCACDESDVSEFCHMLLSRCDQLTDEDTCSEPKCLHDETASSLPPPKKFPVPVRPSDGVMDCRNIESQRQLASAYRQRVNFLVGLEIQQEVARHARACAQ
eukprot:CAMPEP_0113699024 /NCGR_PEP_ID=MMETSP0038_2-20120614/23059_1 /TAXON_ID=2898 /ORGANISM="Cryptomonas paramecium" /LENGTH=155 /DNA_ID=CAMNT_0000622299 /DNA_START=56 /DNA_END=523 /DNA_ORIENTATION=- /assembly_acc=CAM_ASM_000170